MDDKPIYYDTFLNRPPNWLMRWGILMVFVFFSLLIAFSFFVAYNEVIKAEILVTSENPPVDIFGKKSGKLVYTNFESGQQVAENTILAVIESPSNYRDIFYLEEQLQDSLSIFDTPAEIYNVFPSTLELETGIHTSYQKFLRAFQNYVLYRNLNASQREGQNLSSRIERLARQIDIKRGQLRTARRNYVLNRQQNERYRKLFEKGVVSRQQLDASEQELLVAKNDIHQIGEELEGLHVDTLGLNELNAKAMNKDVMDASSHFSGLQLAKQELKSKIDGWEASYVLKSPVSGTVSVFDVWKSHQNIRQGEHVLTVVPVENRNLIGKCKVPIRNSAKLKKGQQVNIKLDNYPYREWGMLRGTVLNVSQTPKKGTAPHYTVYVSIPDLKTTYGKEIIFKQEMFGQAKIVMGETSLIKRVLYQFRTLWEN